MQIVFLIVLFAIVDIETTGGFASSNSITEIAVCVHDGEKVIDEWQSLIRPEQNIPSYITTLTGIDNEMVADAPTFEEIASELDEITRDKVFVAHNVGFDYSFIKRHFEGCGIKWNRRKLCTVRLGKKAFPGHRSYSLANFCKRMGVYNEQAHRAMGDTKATAEIFTMIIEEMGMDKIDEALKRGSGEAFLPNNLPVEVFRELPEEPGVYYFLDSKGKNIYIGKARNIKDRVKQHFSGKNLSERRQGFLTEVHHVSYELTGNELVALLVEDREIKKFWPKYNRAQKFNSGKFGIYNYADQRGFQRLCVKKATHTHQPIRPFTSAFRARQWLFKFAEQYELDFRLCGLPFTEELDHDVEEYNSKVLDAIERQNKLFGSFLIKGSGREMGERSIVWVDNGKLRGIGFVHESETISHVDDLENHIEEIPHSATSEGILRAHLDKVSPRSIVVLEEPEEYWEE